MSVIVDSKTGDFVPGRALGRAAGVDGGARFALAALLLVVAACGSASNASSGAPVGAAASGGATPGTGGSGAGGAGSGGASGAPGAAKACADDGACRLLADYCTGCDCRAWAEGEVPPVCPGPGVRCFSDPCAKKQASCQKGRCVVIDAVPPGKAPKPTYDPCAGKRCGDMCHICPPDDPTCMETAQIKQCSADGKCTSDAPVCPRR